MSHIEGDVHQLPDLTAVHDQDRIGAASDRYIKGTVVDTSRPGLVEFEVDGNPMYASTRATGYMQDAFHKAGDASEEIGRPRNTHWEKPIRKTIYTVNIGNYAPEITALTYPLMKNYARKVGAEFHVITERKFPEWPVVYEKLQVYELARFGVPPSEGPFDPLNPRSRIAFDYHPNDWNIVIDSDALISPEFFDVTDHLSKDTVCHNGRDMAGLRWKYDPYFRRDGRHFGSCNWFTVASDWCLDLWRPLDDLTLEEALTRINTTIQETQGGHCPTDHLIDDFTLSRNIARFGLKATTMVEICGKLGLRDQHGNGVNPYLWHIYSCSHEEKITKMLNHLTQPPDKGGWGIMSADEASAYKQKWGIK